MRTPGLGKAGCDGFLCHCNFINTKGLHPHPLHHASFSAIISDCEVVSKAKMYFNELHSFLLFLLCENIDFHFIRFSVISTGTLSGQAGPALNVVVFITSMSLERGSPFYLEKLGESTRVRMR